MNHFLCSVKVLILHQHFKTPQSGGAIRSYYLAKALVDNGVAVEVITAHQHQYEKLNIEGIIVHYLQVPYSNSYTFIQRSVAFLKFLWKSVRLSASINNVKLCYAISVPLTVGVAAMRIQKRHNIPYYFEVGDLWPDAPVQMGFVTNSLFKKYLFGLEKRIYASSMAIVALSPSIKAAIQEKCGEKEVYVIPNMADTDFYNRESKDVALEDHYDVRGKFVVSYIGAIGLANGLDYLIECANASCKASLPMHFFICGEGALKERLQREAQGLGLSNLSFVDFKNRDGVKKLMNVTDASFVCYQRYPILETGSPNKFFDGLAAGKLIVINFGGWIKDEVEENQCGIHVDSFKPDDFVKKIKPFLTDKLLLERFQVNARALAERKFSRKILSKRYLDIIINA